MNKYISLILKHHERTNVECCFLIINVDFNDRGAVSSLSVPWLLGTKQLVACLGGVRYEGIYTQVTLSRRPILCPEAAVKISSSKVNAGFVFSICLRRSLTNKGVF